VTGFLDKKEKRGVSENSSFFFGFTIFQVVLDFLPIAQIAAFCSPN
jgi:hypothetical protein